MTDRELSLYLVSGAWLIAPSGSGEPGPRTLSPVYQYHGALVPTPRGMNQMHKVMPISGLSTLRLLTVTPEAIVPLATLGREERRPIEKAWEECEAMVGSIRAEMSGVKSVRLVAPNGSPVGS